MKKSRLLSAVQNLNRFKNRYSMFTRLASFITVNKSFFKSKYISMLQLCMLGMGFALASSNYTVAATMYEFSSPSTGFDGSITIDDSHPSFVPGGAIVIGGAITDFTFTYNDNLGLNTYTPADLEVVPLSLQFSASGVNPNNIIFVAGSYRDSAPPLGGNIRFEFGGINSGGSSGPNGQFIGASTGNLSFNDGTFSAVPIPSALYLFGTGLLGLAGIARRKKAA